MGFWGGAAKVRSRVVDVEVLDFNDSPTGGGLLPAPGGDESLRASTTKTIQSSGRGGGKNERKEDGKK